MIINGKDMYDLNPDEERFFRRACRTLRIRVPAVYPGTGDPSNRHSGLYYGLSREEAKALIQPLAEALNWYGYLGSK